MVRKYITREAALGLPQPDYRNPSAVYHRDLVAAVKAIRAFATGFESRDGFDLRNVESWEGWRKGLVTKYVRQVQALTIRPHMVVTPKAKAPRERKKQLAKLQHVGQHAPGFPRLKVAVIPKMIEGQEVKITRGGDVRVITPVGEHVLIDFDKRKLAEGDFQALAEAALRQIHKYRASVAINIQAGQYVIRRGAIVLTYTPTKIGDYNFTNTARYLANWLHRLAVKYPQTNMHHAYTQWMNGLSIFVAGKGKALKDVTRATEEFRQTRLQRLEDRRNERRRRQVYLETYRAARRFMSSFTNEQIVDRIQRIGSKAKRSVGNQASLDAFRDELKRRFERGEG